MYLAVYLLPLLIPAIAALAARPLADRLPPRAATWLLAGSALVLAAVQQRGARPPRADRRLPHPGRGRPRPYVRPRDQPGEPGVHSRSRSSRARCWRYAALAAARALLHRRRAIAAAGRRARDLPGAGQVVVTEDESADAYTLPGWPCSIVVTAGMLRALTEPERRVCSLTSAPTPTGSHYLFTAVARLAAAANPLLRPVADRRRLHRGAVGRRGRRRPTPETGRWPPRPSPGQRWPRRPARPGRGRPARSASSPGRGPPGAGQARCRAGSRRCCCRRPGCACCSSRARPAWCCCRRAPRLRQRSRCISSWSTHSSWPPGREGWDCRYVYLPAVTPTCLPLRGGGTRPGRPGR